MNIVRLYNQNRKAIWIAILIIVSFLILIQVINYLVKINKSNSLEISSNSENSINSSYNATGSTATSNTSGVTGATINEDKLSEAQDVFDEFYGYCNEKKLEEAYSMLTDDCKELIYPSLDLFEANYYDNIFGGEKKIYSFENWVNDIYIVTVEDDILETGKTNEEVEKKIDYVTLEDGKLNISAFVGKENINKTTSSRDITFVVETREIYMDYEVYNLTVTNNSSNTICLASVDSSENVCLIDENENSYDFYNHEVLQDSLVLRSNYTKSISLKFYSSYVTTKEIEYIVFKNVFTNYVNDKEELETIYVDI